VEEPEAEFLAGLLHGVIVDVMLAVTRSTSRCAPLQQVFQQFGADAASLK